MKRSRLKRSGKSRKTQRLRHMDMKPSDKNLWVEWDVNKIAEGEIKFRREEQEAEVKANERITVDSEEKISNEVYEDSDLFDGEWDMVTESLSDLMTKVNKTDYWVADVSGFGWRGLSGSTGVIQASNGQELLEKILPKTECTFKVFKVGNRIMIQNWHHDAPTGNEWYTIRPATAKEVKEERGY